MRLPGDGAYEKTNLKWTTRSWAVGCGTTTIRISYIRLLANVTSTSLCVTWRPCWASLLRSCSKRTNSHRKRIRMTNKLLTSAAWDLRFPRSHLSLTAWPGWGLGFCHHQFYLWIKSFTILMTEAQRPLACRERLSKRPSWNCRWVSPHSSLPNLRLRWCKTLTSVENKIGWWRRESGSERLLALAITSRISVPWSQTRHRVLLKDHGVITRPSLSSSHRSVLVRHRWPVTLLSIIFVCTCFATKAFFVWYHSVKKSSCHLMLILQHPSPRKRCQVHVDTGVDVCYFFHCC